MEPNAFYYEFPKSVSLLPDINAARKYWPLRTNFVGGRGWPVSSMVTVKIYDNETYIGNSPLCSKEVIWLLPPQISTWFMNAPSTQWEKWDTTTNGREWPIIAILILHNYALECIFRARDSIYSYNNIDRKVSLCLPFTRSSISGPAWIDPTLARLRTITPWKYKDRYYENHYEWPWLLPKT